MKFCKECKQKKHIDQFHKDKYTLDGRKEVCMSCTFSLREKMKIHKKYLVRGKITYRGLSL